MIKKLREKLGGSAKYVEFGLIVLMFLLSFITFKNIFSQTKGGDYFQEVIAALIGTLLTIIITFVLLREQTKTEELKEQNVEVFKKRITRYEEMIQLLVDVSEGGKIDAKEAKLLLKAVYNLSLVSSEETIFALSQYVESIIFEDEYGNTFSLVDVITRFRSELKLEGIDDSSVDLQSIEELLASGFDKTDFSRLKKYTEEIAEKVLSAFEKQMSADIIKSYEFSGFVRNGRSASFFVVSARTEISFQIILDYGDSNELQNLRLGLLGSGITDRKGDRKPPPKSKMQRAEKHAIEREFEIDTEDWEIFKYYPMGNVHGRVLTPLNLRKLSQRIAEDILSVEGFDLTI